MRKKGYKRLLAGMLCIALLLTNGAMSGMSVLATEANPTEMERPDTEESSEKTEDSETGSGDDLPENPSGEDTPEESKTPGENGENTDEPGEGDGSSGEDNAENADENGGDGEENTEETETEVSEEEDGDGEESEETGEDYVLTTAADDIASGVVDEDYGHITWRIDANGKLTVNGWGDYTTPFDSIYYRVAPWNNAFPDYPIKSAEINVSGMTDASNMFERCWELTSIDLSNFDTSQIADMERMFNHCRKLTSLDLSGFDTKQVTNMSSMFADCNSLISLDVSHFDTHNVTDMSSMFGGCNNLTNLDLTNFNTSNVTGMTAMFSGCTNLTNLKISSFNTANVTDMSRMFFDCHNLANINLSGFNTSNVKYMYGMFSNCRSLVKLNLSNFDTRNVRAMGSWAVSMDSGDTVTEGMFSGCSNLKELNLSSFNTSNVIDMYGMFHECSSLEILDLSHFNVCNVTDMGGMFTYCYNLSTIYSPYNVNCSCLLPGDTWRRSDGTIVTELPQNLSYSIVLEKSSEPPTDIVQNDITVNGRGYACATFTLKNNAGKIQKNATLEYGFDGLSTYQATSDQDGLITIKSPLLKNTSAQEESKQFKTVDMILHYNSGKTETLNYKVTMNAVVTPLNFSQTWELATEGTLTGGVGAGVGLSAGAEVEAELAKAQVSGTSGGTLSVEHAYENGFRTLTLLQKYDAKVAAKVSVGPAAKADALGKTIDLKAAEASGNITTGKSVGVGLKIEKYDPSDAGQLWDIGKFMLATRAQSGGDLMLLKLAESLGMDIYNQEQSGIVLSTGIGADLGSIRYNDKTKGSLLSGNATQTATYDITRDQTDNSREYAFGFQLGKNVDILEIPIGDLKENIWSYSENNKLKLSAKINEGNQVDQFKIQKEETAKSGSLIFEKSTAEKVSVTYGRESVEQLRNNVDMVGDFLTGSTQYILGDAQKELYAKLDAAPCKGVYSTKTANKEKIKIDIPLGIQLGAELKASVGLEGVSSCEYETTGGTYEAGQRNITNINDIEDEVTKNSYTIGAILTEPISEIGKKAADFVSDVWGSVKDGVSNAYAEIKQDVSETVSQWTLHIVALKDSIMGSSIPQSYEITAYSMESPLALTTYESADTNEYTAYTVGDPYYVYVTDESENEITDYSINPLTLTLRYTDEMLTSAGLSGTEAGKLAIYQYSEDFYGYVCIGGSVNTTDKAVSVEITKPGQYVLAVDSAAPAVKEIRVSPNTNKPLITVTFNETSGFQEFSMKLDNKEVISTANRNDYYNRVFNSFSYQVNTALSDGKHTCSVYAVDTAGNAMTAPYEIEFYIGETSVTDDPESVLPEDIPPEGIPEDLWIAGIDTNGYAYTGKAIKPTVRVYDGNKRLKDKTDYTVSYKNNTKANDASNAKTAPTITVTGKGNYSGKETVTFKILPVTLTADSMTVADMTKVYNKKIQKPVPSITVNGKKLRNKTDFTVSYPDAAPDAYKAVGTYTITVAGTGNYTGEQTLTFDITDKTLISKVSVTKIPNQAYTGDALTPAPVVKYKKAVLVEHEDYELEYQNNTAIGKATVILKGKGSYIGQKTVTFQITGGSLKKAKVTGLVSPMVYTGREIRQNCVLTIKVNGEDITLQSGKDYTVTYQKNTSAGTAKVIFTGINGYTGTLQKSYKITPYDILQDSGSYITYAKDIVCAYMKGGSRPEPDLYFKGVLLKKGTDYTLSYKNNNAVQGSKTPMIIVKGKSCFKNKLEIPFTIRAQNLANMRLASCDKVYKNKSNIYQITPKLLDTNGKALQAGKDFDKKSIAYTYANDVTLENETIRKAGDSVEKTDIIPANTQICITLASGSGNLYEGMFTGTYRIVAADLKSAKVSIPAQTYTGSEIRPDKTQMTVKLSKTELSPDDYEIVSYANNIKKGNASVTLVGKGNYGGTKTVRFKIKAKGFLWWWR